MRIAFIIPTLSAGGAERVVTHMANFWAERKYQVSIITLSHPKESPFYTLSSKVELVQLDLLEEKKSFQKLFLFYKQWNAVRNEVKRIQPNVLIAFLDITIFLALAIRPFIKAKVIVSERNNPYLNETHPLLKKINHFLYQYADQLVLQTFQIAHTFSERLQNKITVIPNPVVVPEVRIENYEKGSSTYTIMSMGRLKWQKGYDILIKAFAPLAKTYKEWTLVIIGEGDERTQLETLSEKEEISEQVKLVGRKSNPHEMLKEASIFVLSSRFEGFPNALCEAMAIGLPCVATRCPFGPDEIIEHDINGLLVEANDDDALRDALASLMRSAVLRKRLGEQAQHITEQFAITKVMAQWEQLVERI